MSDAPLDSYSMKRDKNVTIEARFQNVLKLTTTTLQVTIVIVFISFAATNECKGAHHGAYLPDDGNCSIFYRCVWDRLVQMNCPNGTVFNPTLSVCDWPANVPKCNSVTGTPSADAAVPASLY